MPESTANAYRKISTKIPSLAAAVIAAASLVFAFGCGVKGKPMPPEVPPEIGRGRPEVSSAFEELSIPIQPTATPLPDLLERGTQ